MRYPETEEVRAFIRDAEARGSAGVSFWSYEHMCEEMWAAVGAETIGVTKEEDEMSSEEFSQVTHSLGELSSRIERLEADVTALRGGVAAPPAAPPQRTYTVATGDTLSGIAIRLGIDDWRRLYEANIALIGLDPNRIYPGQVLVLP
ncbi:MAG TPA: LysM domain-containing protein [Dehalococcoidia bacterium]|nr:LysM domain-containing protein [Dehalococcoidia bacterium]